MKTLDAILYGNVLPARAGAPTPETHLTGRLPGPPCQSFYVPARPAGCVSGTAPAPLLGGFFWFQKLGVGCSQGDGNMTNAELESELKRASTNERVLTKKIVELIAEALRGTLWSGRGYASAHRWLVGEFGYSDSSAGRRLDAARLLFDVPDVAEKLATGELTLSGLSQLQSAIHQEEKRTGEKVTADVKQAAVKKIENQTSAGASRTVAAEFPEVSKAPRESLKPAGADGWTLTIGLDAAQKKALERARELLSHSRPGATWAEIIAYLADEHARRADPLARAERREVRTAKAGKMPQGFTATEDRPPQPSDRMPLPRAVRDLVLARAGGACEFADPRTGARCGSRTRVEVDHVLPKALGGRDEEVNLRCLCAQHNRFEAKRKLGPQWASSWKRKSQTG